MPLASLFGSRLVERRQALLLRLLRGRGVAGLAVFSGGRGRGNGNFLCSRPKTIPRTARRQAAKRNNRMLKRLRPVAIIKPRAVVSPATRISAGPLALAY